MTDKPRRPRSDSIGNLQRVIAGADKKLDPPQHVPLQAADRPYWQSILSEFARADWTRHQLDMAAFLARIMGHLEAEQRQLFIEGMLVERSDGTRGTNPRSRLVAGLTSQLLAIRRSLGLTGRAKAGSTRDAVRVREANRRIENAAAGSDELLA